jgi:hypothetical protein
MVRKPNEEYVGVAFRQTFGLQPERFRPFRVVPNPLGGRQRPVQKSLRQVFYQRPERLGPGPGVSDPLGDLPAQPR